MPIQLPCVVASCSRKLAVAGAEALKRSVHVGLNLRLAERLVVDPNLIDQTIEVLANARIATDLASAPVEVVMPPLTDVVRTRLPLT